MDLRRGTKRIKSIFKGSEYIPGLMVNDRLWHGSPGKVTFTSDFTNGGGDKVYYNIAVVSPVQVYISSGGFIKSSTITHSAYAWVSSGGAVDNSTVESHGKISILSDGVANNITAIKKGVADVYSGGTANDTTIHSDGYMYIKDGGTANSTAINSGGDMYIEDGGTANDTTIHSSGGMGISSGGTANSTTINSRGSMRIDSGGTATNITANSNAVIEITVTSNTYIQGSFNGSAFEMKDAFISGYTANGDMSIESGGTATNTIVNNGGSVTVKHGAEVDNIVENGGYVDLAFPFRDKAETIIGPHTINNLTASIGNMTVHKNTTASNTLLLKQLYIYSGGVVDRTSVKGQDGGIHVLSGGIANNTYIYPNNRIYRLGSDVVVSSGGMMNNVSFLSHTNAFDPTFGGGLVVLSGGTATGILIPSNISIYDSIYFTITVASNTYIQGTSNGSAFEMKDAFISGHTVNGGMFIESGGTATNTTVSRGSMRIDSGGTANETTVHEGGNVYVSHGGIANGMTINMVGYLTVSSGGTALNVTSKNGAHITVENGGYITYK